jgi:hypothetical protein
VQMDGPSAMDRAYSGPSDPRRLGRAAQAAHLLSEELWEALQNEVAARSTRDVPAGVNRAALRRTAALAERLSDVAASLVLLASPERGASGPSPVGEEAGAWRARKPAASPPPQAQVNAVLIDERDEAVPDSGPARVMEAARQAQPMTRPRPWPWDAPVAERPPASASTAHEEIASENGQHRPGAGVELIAAALKRFEQDRLPFAVFLIEVQGVEELHRGLRLSELPQLIRQIENAATRALDAIGARSAASLTLDGASRLWLQVPEMDRLEAHHLVERLVGPPEQVAPTDAPDPARRYFATLAGSRSPSWTQNGRRLELAIGTAIFPDDGQDAVALATHATRQLGAMRDATRPGSEPDEPA